MSDKEIITHKEFMRRQTQVLTQVSLEQVIAAFVASLRTAPLVYRSTLVSWSRLALMPRHSLIDLGDNHGCSVCGVRESNTMITEELISQKHSGSCIGYPQSLAALIDLEHFITLPVVTPTSNDFALLEEILSIAAQMPTGSRPSHLFKALKKFGRGVPLREAICEGLAALGVLRCGANPSPIGTWAGTWRRNEMPNLASDLEWPFCWWRGEDGIDGTLIERFFPELTMPPSWLMKRPTPLVLEDQALKLPALRGQRPRLELDRGTLMAIELGSCFFLARVHGSAQHGKKRLVVLEFMKRVFNEMPDDRTLAGFAEYGNNTSAVVVESYELIATSALPLIGKVWQGALTVLTVPGKCEAFPSLKSSSPLRVVEERNFGYFLKEQRTLSLLSDQMTQSASRKPISS